MLDSFAVGNIISQNLALKNRILVEKIPSGRDHLTALVSAMKSDRVVNITYHPFRLKYSTTFRVEPYCVKLFENRWYLLGRSVFFDELRIYGLDRIENVEQTDETFRLPKNFDAVEYFSGYFGIVTDSDVPVERIIIRSNRMHANYLRTLPLHHSQTLKEDYGEYCDFELRLAPTYDFIMKLLQCGSMVEVIEPAKLRHQVKGWISDMYNAYRED